MYPEIPFWASAILIASGLWLLTWSANQFVGGAEAVSRAMGVSPFIVGMVVIGFGTSAPELAVSALSGMTGHSNLSLGNAYGSNIFNIAAILGIAAIIHPIVVRPVVIFAAVPMLTIASFASCMFVCLGDGFSRMDGVLCLVLFVILLPVYCYIDRKGGAENGDSCSNADLPHPFFSLVIGLAMLVASSHILVWGAVDLARALGVSELLIGLTIIAAGTSIPELASAIVSARQGQHEFVLGNIIGSNFFNTLAVVGLSGTIAPFKDISPYIFYRDLPMMTMLTLSIAIFGVNLKRPRADGYITRKCGMFYCAAFVVYLALLISQEIPNN